MKEFVLIDEVFFYRRHQPATARERWLCEVHGAGVTAKATGCCKCTAYLRAVNVWRSRAG